MGQDHTLEQRIARVEAHLAIERLIADLGHAFDNGPSAELLRELFTVDAVFEIDRYGTLEGAGAIAKGVAGNAQSGFRWTLHYLVSPRIDLADNALEARLSFRLWEAATAASRKDYWIGGSYDALAVMEDRWRFRHLRLNAELISHYPEGWREKPATLDQA